MVGDVEAQAARGVDAVDARPLAASRPRSAPAPADRSGSGGSAADRAATRSGVLALQQARAAQRQHPLVRQLLDIEIGMHARAQADADVDAVGGEVGIGRRRTRCACRCRDAAPGSDRCAAPATSPSVPARRSPPGCDPAWRDRAARRPRAGSRSRCGCPDRSAAPPPSARWRARGAWNSLSPSRSSSPRIWWLSAAGVTCSSSAALEKLAWRAVASNALSAFRGGRGRRIG